MKSDPDSQHGNQPIPKNAFLIVEGDQVFSLDRALINIGRRSDNQLVIDDPRVSRAHAQVRVIAGQFVLFDLQSKGGTSVNGRRIERAVLSPGDVISLAGVPLLFGLGTADKTLKHPLTSLLGSTGPTNAVDLNEADRYLDMFANDSDAASGVKND